MIYVIFFDISILLDIQCHFSTCDADPVAENSRYSLENLYDNNGAVSLQWSSESIQSFKNWVCKIIEWSLVLAG